MTTEAKRNALYSRLQEVLGDEPAATLMAMYTGEPATKTDLIEARDELRGEMSAMRDELRGEMSAMRDELRGEISSLRLELKGDIAEIREDIRELRFAVQSNVRTFVVTQTSTVLAVAAIVLAYDRFL